LTRRRSRSKSQRQYVPQNDASVIAAGLRGAKGARIRGFILPCLATLRDKVPSGTNWIHEIKFDGYRLQLHKNENDIRFYTRRGYDWTKRFSSLVTAAWYLPATHLILDGEVTVPTEEGRSDFGALEAALGSGTSDFDLLHINGLSLRDCALEDRKKVLDTLLLDQTGPLVFSEHLGGDGDHFFRNACEMELEGIVSKRRDSKYRSGRRPDWTKRTCRNRETFVVAGIAVVRGKFEGIYLARRKKGELLYAGKVEKGFDAKMERDLRAAAEKLKTPTQPLTKKIKKPKAIWLKPKLLVDVEYRALTGTGKLRHPSFKGVREDLT